MKRNIYILAAALAILCASIATITRDSHAAIVATDYITVTTDASGDATAYSGKTYNGELRLIGYVKDDFPNGVDFTITSEDTGQTLWTQTDQNATAVRYPLTAAVSPAGVAVTYDGTRPIYVPITLVNERIKVVIGSGGDTKSGIFAFAVEGI